MILTRKACLGLALLGICAVGISRSAAAQTVTNGGFDNVAAFDPLNTGVQTISSVINPNGLSGWQVTGGSVDLVKNSGTFGWQSENGNQSLDLSGLRPGTLSQTIQNLTVGQTYRISFWLASNPLGPRIQDMTASFGSVSNQYFEFDKQNPGPGSGSISSTNMLWKEFSFTAQATGTSNALVFTAGSNNLAFGPAMDNVSIAAVPEASGLMNLAGALLAPGIGMIAIRRRARKSRAAAAC